MPHVVHRLLRLAPLLALFLLPACQASGAHAPKPFALKTIHVPTGHCGHCGHAPG